MKRSYKIIELHEVSETSRKKRGIALIERTIEEGYGRPATVDTIEVRYPIWDGVHFTSNICLDQGGVLDYVSSRLIKDEIDKLVRPVKEETNE